MKVSRMIFVPLLSLALLSQLTAQNTSEKTLSKSFNLNGNDVVDLDLEGNVEVQHWNSPTVRVEMVVSLENGNESTLKSLIRAGRYHPIAKQSSTDFKISMPGLKRELMVGGEQLRDNISYVVTVPSDVIVRNDLGTAAGMR